MFLLQQCWESVKDLHYSKLLTEQLTVPMTNYSNWSYRVVIVTCYMNC